MRDPKITRIVRRRGHVVSDTAARPVPRPRPVGLGDLAAMFAKPVAAAIDWVTEQLLTDEMKTDLANCPACAQRQRKWNLVCPDILTCPRLGTIMKLLPGSARQALLAAAEKHAKPANPDATP